MKLSSGLTHPESGEELQLQSSFNAEATEKNESQGRCQHPQFPCGKRDKECLIETPTLASILALDGSWSMEVAHSGWQLVANMQG